MDKFVKICKTKFKGNNLTNHNSMKHCLGKPQTLS